MTRNLLYGFSTVAKELIFVPVISHDTDRMEIEKFYGGLYSRIIFANDVSKYKKNVFARQIEWLIYALVNTNQSIVPGELLQEMTNDTVLISQSPSVDSALICKQLKKHFSNVDYIQYWGDPLALSLITPEEYNISRVLLKWTEQILHKSADRVVYGTKSLFEAELSLFPGLHDKASYCLVSYMPETKTVNNHNKRVSFGYYGNYYSSIRNIVPLYEAFCEIPDAELVICGSTDLHLKNTENISVRERIPQSEVEEQESRIDVDVCILNSVGVQIPGKVFYHTNTNRIILVVLDGPRRQQIKEELAESHRFVFCENDINEIKKTVTDILSGVYDGVQYDQEYYSPAKVSRQMLFEGDSYPENSSVF